MIQSLRMLSTVVLAFNAKRKSEEGATAVEYGLLVALIAAVIVGLVVTLGENIAGGFTTVNTEMGGETAPE
jgi:pilus assembly protein Flp/PilA